MADIEYLPVSWNLYHTIAQKLATAIFHDGKPFDEIVAISRGGLTLGHLMADLLNLPISTFAIQSYTDIRTQGEVKITLPLNKPIADKRILLVDDVADSGITINRAIEYLESFKPKRISVLTMFLKPRSVFVPRYFARKTTKWILFPYEPTEMIKNISLNMGNGKQSKKLIQSKLMELGYTESQISFVRKYHLVVEKD